MIGEGYTSCLAKSCCQQEKQQQNAPVCWPTITTPSIFKVGCTPFLPYWWPCSKLVLPIFWGHEFCWICMKNWRDHRQCNAPLVSAEMGDRCLGSFSVKFSPRPKDCSHVISILSTKPRTLLGLFLFRFWGDHPNKNPSNMIPIPHVFFNLSMFCTGCFYLTDCLSSTLKFGTWSRWWSSCWNTLEIDSLRCRNSEDDEDDFNFQDYITFCIPQVSLDPSMEAFEPA